MSIFSPAHPLFGKKSINSDLSIEPLPADSVARTETVLPEAIKTSLFAALTDCEIPRGDLINFVHKSPLLINSGLFDHAQTLLHIAARAGKIKIVQWLVLKGAKYDVIDAHAATPADLAAVAGAAQTAAYLRNLHPSPKVLAQVETKSIKSALNSRFIDNGDGTVWDTQTGLTWMRFAEGQEWDGVGCTGQAKQFNFDGASAIRRDFAGFNDWRLPTVDELKSIVDPARKNPAFDPAVFFNYGITSNPLFWTSTSADNGWWYVSFLSGASFTAVRQSRNAVRLVRDGSKVDIVTSGTGFGAAATNPKAQADRAAFMEGIQFSTALNVLQVPENLVQVETKKVNSVLPPRFVDNGNGTALDTQTGLTWMRFAEGQGWNGGTGSGRAAMRYSFSEANAIHRDFAGNADWRLPTVDELEEIVAASRVNSHLNPNLFLGIEEFGSTAFWTSTRADLSTESGVISGVRIVNLYLGQNLTVATHRKCLIRLVRGVGRPCPDLHIAIAGTGFGTVNTNPQQEKHARGSTVTLSARPQLGSIFTGWSGDVSGGDLTCSLVMDADKHVTANFEEKLFALHITQTGNGSGVVNRGPAQALGNGDDRQRYPAGASVILIAEPAPDSVFAGWNGDANGANPILDVLMAAEKSVNANFLPKSFELDLARDGSGSVTATPARNSHPVGTVVTLSAIPRPGWVFSGWSGDATGSAANSTVVMDSAKVVTAHFSRMSFGLEVATTGVGTGSITRSPDTESYDYGSTVTLTACPAGGSVFNCWHGDAAGLDATCAITIDSAKTVTAEFARLDIPDLGIGVTFDCAEQTSMKSGDDAFIVYLSVANKGQKQIQVELPMSAYVTRQGEEIEQDAWLTGLIIGGKGAAIGAGAFRKAGLVFFKSKLHGISTGDHLFVTVSQVKPARRCDFTFRCTDQNSRAFTLVNAIAEDALAPEGALASVPDATGILRRLELLEAGLSDVLRKLEALQAVPPGPAKKPARQDEPAPTLVHVLAWLATQERVSMATLRAHLLPLDLLPGAVMDELNEQALDLIGELALEEVGDEIVVARGVLATVIANLE